MGTSTHRAPKCAFRIAIVMRSVLTDDGRTGTGVLFSFASVLTMDDGFDMVAEKREKRSWC